MSGTSPIAVCLPDLLARRELSEEKVRAALAALMTGPFDDAEAAAFLIALRMKGETAGEIAAAARVLREHMIGWQPPCDDVLDTCGTGGDGTGTFNISTATALVVAAAGVPVVKHGNRSASSRTGSADVLAALGVRINGDAEHARMCLREAGFAFCFAPQFHPALRHVASLRQRLGVPTLFNCVGPLANPAGARRQLLGVGRRELLDLIAGALAHLGSAQALIVCGADGLDEVTLSAATYVRQVRGGQVSAHEWTPTDFGLEPVRLDDLTVRDAAESAGVIEAVLAGADGPARRIVLANAAAAFLAAEQVKTPRAGVDRAAAALDSGRALRVLQSLRALAAASADQP